MRDEKDNAGLWRGQCRTKDGETIPETMPEDNLKPCRKKRCERTLAGGS